MADARALPHRVQVVVVSARDQFRGAGGTARELEERHVRGQRAVDPRQGPARCPGFVSDRNHEGRDLGEIGIDLGREVPVRGETELVDGDIPAGRCRGAELVDLCGAVRSQGEHRQGTDLEQREHDLDVLDGVRHMDDHAVAAAESLGGECARDDLHSFREFGVGHCAPRIHYRRPIRMGRHSTVEERRMCLPDPVPFSRYCAANSAG